MLHHLHSESCVSPKKQRGPPAELPDSSWLVSGNEQTRPSSVGSPPVRYKYEYTSVHTRGLLRLYIYGMVRTQVL